MGTALKMLYIACKNYKGFNIKTNHCPMQKRTIHNLPKILSVLNIIPDVFLTRICADCGWDEATLNHYLKNSDQIPISDRQTINHIIQDQFNHLAQHCPRISQN
ncbi:hypothetical protein [Chitinophaga sp. SYP-B3965]|uniref:hypothetical protein n=1 Tax=Chitinophaga sp. SYP-B3965 TaxID=2663120 RepID=UPI001565D1E6|nr:hypothetical protein [Chitinophaga sp. SYP-B3965]